RHPHGAAARRGAAAGPAADHALAPGRGGGMSPLALHPLLADFGGALEFIFHKQVSNVTGGHKVGGFDQVLELALKQIEVSVLALLVATLVALPVGLYFGHRGAGAQLAVA